LRPLSDTLHGLVAVLGALPNDYVSAMEAAWSPHVTLRLGEVELIQRGVLVFVIMQAVTEKIVACIGRTRRKGTYHQVLFMSYRVDATGNAIDLSYELAWPFLHASNYMFDTYVEMIGALVGEYLDIMQIMGTDILIPATQWKFMLDAEAKFMLDYIWGAGRDWHRWQSKRLHFRYELAKRLYVGHCINCT
jgi:hypothetical protein